MLDKNKKKLSSADLVIASFFGESSKEMYGEDYEKLEKYLKEHKMDNIPWFESEEGAEYAKKAMEKFAPLVAEIAEKNRKSKISFAKLKELITNNNNSEIAASIKGIIESLEDGAKEVFTSAKSNVIETWKNFRFISSADGLMFTAGTTRDVSSSNQIKKNYEFVFNADVDYDGEIIHDGDIIKIIIKCDNKLKEFFITGNGFSFSGTPLDGIVEFITPDKGELIVSLDGKYFMTMSLK